jgi:hypothetical protein
MAGTRPCIFLKSISISNRASLFSKSKKPAELVRVSGLNLDECWPISGMHPRRLAMRVMMMAVMAMRQHRHK